MVAISNLQKASILQALVRGFFTVDFFNPQRHPTYGLRTAESPPEQVAIGLISEHHHEPTPARLSGLVGAYNRQSIEL
jgi:hypothetical protein